ncbi:hypothetical protein ACFL59_06420, partial [Planctomycetota bacterium]
MEVLIREEPLERLRELATISIAFLVDRVFEVASRDSGLGGIILLEHAMAPPYVKDYDAIDGNHP